VSPSQGHQQSRKEEDQVMPETPSGKAGQGVGQGQHPESRQSRPHGKEEEGESHPPQVIESSGGAPFFLRAKESPEARGKPSPPAKTQDLKSRYSDEKRPPEKNGSCSQP